MIFCWEGGFCGWILLPKGPFRTKNSTESKFTTARKIRYGSSKTLRRVLRSACFSRRKRQKNGTDSEKLRQQQNTTDSGTVLFLVRKGPLGLLSERIGWSPTSVKSTSATSSVFPDFSWSAILLGK